MKYFVVSKKIIHYSCDIVSLHNIIPQDFAQHIPHPYQVLALAQVLMLHNVLDTILVYHLPEIVQFTYVSGHKVRKKTKIRNLYN